MRAGICREPSENSAVGGSYCRDYQGHRNFKKHALYKAFRAGTAFAH
jgi:hypothetical protein